MAASIPSNNYSSCNDELTNCRAFKEIESGNCSEEAVNHLSQKHFSETGKKNPCQYGEKCHSFIRLANRGSRLEDRCHMYVFSHPPRSRRAKING